MKDYYYMLGLEYEATEGQIKAAYRKLAHKFHPDKNHGDKLFEERFKDIQEAYEVLGSADKKLDYDLKFKGLKEVKKTNLQEQEIIKKYGEELRKKEEEIQRKYKTAAQKAAEEKEIRQKEEEARREEELEKLSFELDKYNNVLQQKEKVLNTVKEEVFKLESEVSQLKTIIHDIDLKIVSVNNSGESENSEAEHYTRTGELFGGGIIIYTNESGEHGLVCSAEDLGKSIWGEAKGLCDNYKGGTHTDWRLPTKEELLLIYQLLFKNKGVKSFASKNYWSSSKNNEDVAWVFDFYTGDAYDDYNKYNAYFVRAVRAF